MAIPLDPEGFGIDLKILPDLDPIPKLQGGRRNLAEALAKRLTTPRGGLFYDPSYGKDIRLLLNETLTEARLRQEEAEIEAEIEKDERIESASATLTVVNQERLKVKIECQTRAGPFALVLAVSAVTVELLRVE